MADPGGLNRPHRTNQLSQRRGYIGSIARFWQGSYAPDYLGLALLLGLYILMRMFMEPFHRMFSLDNIAIQFPHATVERVPPAALFLYGGGLPLAALLLWSIVERKSVHKMHVTILGLFISIFLTVFLTDVVKNAVGRPRPDLIDRCKPAKGTPEHTLVTFEICTETNHHILHDGWRSFPSGHSSFSFAGLGFLALFLTGQLHALRPRTDLSRVLVVLAPLLGAALIAISRCEDYRHDVWDVTTGSILGFVVAYATYRRYFPSLKSRWCDVPYPSRAEILRAGPGKIKGDLEARGDLDHDGLGEGDGESEEDTELLPTSRSSRT